MEDKAYEYYKSVTNHEYIKQFEGNCLSALTKGEIYYGGGFNKEDTKYYEDINEKDAAFEVTGVLYDERINSFSRVKYSFNSLENAEKYFDNVIRIFPLSRVKILKKICQQLRCYA